MSEKVIENNQVSITGTIISKFIFSHEVYGEKFYMVHIESNRLSDQTDIIPLMISEHLLDVRGNYIGRAVKVIGQFRSYNQRVEKKTRLVLYIFAGEIHFTDEEYEDINSIYLDGYICKDPTYRKTPFGREITDLLVAVDYPRRKPDYIPCIVWGKDARYAATLEVGTRINLWGRIQSREYTKKLDKGKHEKRIAYEVSVSKLEKPPVLEH